MSAVTSTNWPFPLFFKNWILEFVGHCVPFHHSLENTITSINPSELKSNALAQLENAYLEVSKVRDSYWGVAALHQVGYAYEQLGKQLASPPAINGASLEDVKKQLAPLSENALKKALEFYTNAQATAKKFGIYSDYTALLAVSLQRSKSGNLAFQDWVVLPDFLGGEVPMSIANKLQ